MIEQIGEVMNYPEEEEEEKNLALEIEEAKNLAAELLTLESKYWEADERIGLSPKEQKLLYEGISHSKAAGSESRRALEDFRKLKELKAKNRESKQENA